MSVGAGVARPAAHERAHRLNDRAALLGGEDGQGGITARVPGTEIIGNLIVKAMRARRPQARYRADFMSWIVTVPRILPDNPFDRLVMAQTQ